MIDTRDTLAGLTASFYPTDTSLEPVVRAESIVAMNAGLRWAPLGSDETLRIDGAGVHREPVHTGFNAVMRDIMTAMLPGGMTLWRPEASTPALRPLVYSVEPTGQTVNPDGPSELRRSMHEPGRIDVRGPSPRRARVRQGVVAVCAAMAMACAAGDGSRLAPESARASLGVSAVVQATTATGIELRAGYLRSDRARVELGAQTVPLGAGATDEATLPVPLGPCLRDPQRAVTGAACEVALELRLMRGATLLDRQTVSARLLPGAAVTVPAPVALYEVQTLAIGFAGAPAADTARLEVPDTLRLAAALRDATGAVVAGRVVVWASTSTATAGVDAVSGLVTAVAPGTATVRATGGGRAGDVTVVVARASVRRLTVAPASLQLVPGSGGALVVVAVDARGAVLPGRVVTYSSSNPLVAAVGSDGTVRGIAPGSAVVTAASAEGPGGTLVTFPVPVTVVAAPTGNGVAGRLVAGATGAAVAGATLRFTINGVAIVTILSASDGSWRTPAIPAGVYGVAIDAPGMRSTAITSVTVSGAVTVPTIPVTLGSVTTGAAQITLRDATTGQRLAVPATMTVVSGIALTSVAVDSLNGSTSGVPAGGLATLSALRNTATIRVRAAGYADALQYVAPVTGQVVAVSLALAPLSPAAGQTRIVLTWGASPADLDAWLVGPTAAGPRVAVSVDAPGSCVASPFACLDVASANGFGPETITIPRPTPGVYHYAVTRRAGAGTISGSGARVDVYVTGQLARTFTPPSGTGEWWHVFDLFNGQIFPVDGYGASAPNIVATGAERATSARPSTTRRP